MSELTERRVSIALQVVIILVLLAIFTRQPNAGDNTPYVTTNIDLTQVETSLGQINRSLDTLNNNKVDLTSVEKSLSTLTSEASSANTTLRGICRNTSSSPFGPC